MRSRTVRVLTCSTRASAGVYADLGGPLVVDALRAAGFDAPDPVVVPDGPAVDAALGEMLAARVDLVVTTGGTGLAPTDGTPEATRARLDREVPGIAEAVRAAGIDRGVPTAVLSRGVAGIAGRTLVVNLPGSPGGVRDALTVLLPLLDHALDQIAGGDH